MVNRENLLSSIYYSPFIIYHSFAFALALTLTVSAVYSANLPGQEAGDSRTKRRLRANWKIEPNLKPPFPNTFTLAFPPKTKVIRLIAIRQIKLDGLSLLIAAAEGWPK
jgi:hypothetical protein